MIFYMGVVVLPSKADYWQNKGMWPVHEITKYISCWRFKMFWLYCSLSVLPRNATEEDLDEGPEGVEEGFFEREIDDDSSSDEDEEVAPVDERWYKKATYIVNHVNRISKKLCVWPSFALAIDEMLKKFKGRCIQTFRFKKKPIKEGYKFWALSDSSNGFIWHFTPATRVGRQAEDGRQVIESTLKLIDLIPRRESKKYVVAMDNFFTWSRAIVGARERGVAVVGTARAKRGWPPKEIRNILDDRFNTLHWMNDVDNYQIQRWIDNNIVMMVSTLHGPNEEVLRERKKPRVTTINRGNIQRVWGDDYIKEVFIPTIIDDYNHWMQLGVD